MNLTKDFTLQEMQCHCGQCNGGTPDPTFMERLQRLRDKCDFPFHINSGWRCFEHNRALPGSSTTSLHLSGRAADISLLWDLSEEENCKRLLKLLSFAHECGLYGVGVGATLVHVDDREAPAMWFYNDR